MKFVVTKNIQEVSRYLVEAEDEDHARSIDEYNAIERVHNEQKTVKIEPFSSLVAATAPVPEPVK